jgi:hypothetical protein
MTQQHWTLQLKSWNLLAASRLRAVSALAHLDASIDRLLIGELKHGFRPTAPLYQDLVSPDGHSFADDDRVRGGRFGTNMSASAIAATETAARSSVIHAPRSDSRVHPATTSGHAERGPAQMAASLDRSTPAASSDSGRRRPVRESVEGRPKTY